MVSVWVAVQECCALCLKVCVCLCACLCISVGGQKNASQENFWALRLSAVKARNAPFPFLLCFQVESASTHHTPSSASRRSKRTWNCLKNTAVQTFCTPKRCIQNRGSAGEDLWSRQCGNPGYQAKKKHIEMTSKWRASFTFPRSLDCSCRLLCWATALLPPQLQTRSTLLPFEATSATPAAAYFFFLCFLWPCPQSYSFLSMFVRRNLTSSSSPSIFLSSSLLPLFVLFLAQKYKEFQHFWRSCLLPLFWKNSVLNKCFQLVLISTAHSHDAPAHITGMLADLGSHFLFLFPLFVCCLSYCCTLSMSSFLSHTWLLCLLWTSHAHYFNHHLK